MIEALGITIVKNEADVIESFVRHNLGFLDALFIADNDSADGTREILVQLRQEGLPIVLFDDPVFGHFQAEKVTDMYRKIVPRFQPRFVFLLDADEFIIAPSREGLYAQLRAMRPGSQAKYYWRTYIPAPTGWEGDSCDPLRGITHRRVSEQAWPKSIIVTKPDIDRKLKIQQGNHNVRYAGRSLPKAKLQGVALAHFPIRSAEQITGKALVGWITNLERIRRRRHFLGVSYQKTSGFQWKMLYDRIIRGVDLTPEELTREALRYAQTRGPEANWPQDVVREPVVPGYAGLTARTTIPSTPLQKIVRCIDRLANPEAGSVDRADATEFLRDPNAETGTWQNFVPSLRTRGNRQLSLTRRRGQRLHLDLPPFRHLAERDLPASVLDIGCGSGAYLKYFRSQGTQWVRGVDSIDGRPGYLEPEEYMRVDLGKQLDLSEKFDLVICMGVIADIPAFAEHTVINNIVRHASKRIVFSSARPGQPRPTQINPQPISHWLSLFVAAGWHPCLFDSLALRSLSTFPWLRGNLVVLTQDSDDAEAARARLTELEQDQTKWDTKQPTVVTHPFTETANRLLAKGKARW